MNIALILAAFEALVAIGMDGAALIQMIREALGRPDAKVADEDWDALHQMEAKWQAIIDKRMQTA